MTSTPTRSVDNVVIATKGLQDRNTNIIPGTTVENKGKLILISCSSKFTYEFLYLGICLQLVSTEIEILLMVSLRNEIRVF